MPDEPSLHSAGRTAAQSITDRIGGTYDVVLSACVLSQLFVPFKKTLAMTVETWALLIGTITEIHLHTIATLLRPGGTGVLLVDSADQESTTETDPHLIAGLIAQDPELSTLFESVRVTEPWAWQLMRSRREVHALLLRKAQ